ncbi:hypothetical protein ACCS91_23695 [Rhizobium ruizarguesonis]|uniref:hypothetical protein n=1 Tax=Rhizobium ruizarguesonis TaxID=2081791 RepID=UPI001031FC23|nr:hypothetical protein [Rhizobium ruizarguesonis]TAW77440.1 hypothetical protein ELI10_09685 [Rhizobium ruizarguesonis]TAX14406.1 hypothetical protein ELI09_09745 [Rhizobium ruizarguesonis]TAX19237.1 hypothetical protein ELI08_09745 [Rhizobium ruizarguesonis]
MIWETVHKTLSEWQTLIGAILALGAALWTVHEMRKQTRGDETRHANDLLRKKLAARAQMPDALTELNEYVRASCRYLVSDEGKPTAPIEGTNTLKAVIEHIDTKEAEKTFDLISWYQVQRSRLMASKNPKPIETAEMLYDAALLQTKIDRLYNYARNEKEEPLPEKPSQDEMFGSLKSAVTVKVWAMKNDDFADVIEIIKRRHVPGSSNALSG